MVNVSLTIGGYLDIIYVAAIKSSQILQEGFGECIIYLNISMLIGQAQIINMYVQIRISSNQDLLMDQGNSLTCKQILQAEFWLSETTNDCCRSMLWNIDIRIKSVVGM